MTVRVAGVTILGKFPRGEQVVVWYLVSSGMRTTTLQQGLAQLGLERVPWKHEVAGSSPVSLTRPV